MKCTNEKKRAWTIVIFTVVICYRILSVYRMGCFHSWIGHVCCAVLCCLCVKLSLYFVSLAQLVYDLLGLFHAVIFNKSITHSDSKADIVFIHFKGTFSNFAVQSIGRS